ncbi:MAG TPA: hypothetical protein VHO69_10835, partial [Phototrophicaceae bacterium]|nr:hypothetical protein [Phototrophicaceae bacterium]
AALWQPLNANDPAWIFPPKFFNEMFLVGETDFWRVLEGAERPIEETAWQIIFDGRELRTSDVGGLLGRIVDGERLVTTVLPSIRLTNSPVQGLTQFTQDVSQLTQQLVIVILPVGGLVLYFVTLVAGLLVSRQQAEDMVLRSRGMSRAGLVSIHTVMWLLLAGISVLVGLLLAPLVVQLVGQTSSFLRFDGTTPPLTVTYTPQAFALGGLTALLAASTGLYLAWRSTGQNVNTFRQRSARARSAWWQRMYLDVLLLIPGVYVYYTLLRQGGLAAAADDPFADPLAFVGPTLFALALTLLFLRVWPFLMRTGAQLVGYSRSVALLMALRELTRSIGRYRGILLMICFTLSLTGVTASMASTIDQSLKDSINYKIGADAVLVTVADTQTEENQSEDSNSQVTYDVTGYNMLPASDLLAIDGVSQVSRVGRYPGRLVLRSRRLEGTILGIDRSAMAAVARFRQDYADEPIADLFNKLAGNRTGVLLHRQTALDNNLLIGQEITFEVSALGEWYEITAPIVGLLDYFPTLNPKDGFFLVTNLDPLFEAVGTELPHDIWLHLKPDALTADLQQQVRALKFPVLEWRDPEAALAAAQADPSRRGVLGFLSVGFVAAILLTLVGAIIQNTVSFRAQSKQLGSLRAMGLSGGAVGTYLILLQGMAATSGILGGTSIGVLTTLLFLPLLDFSGGLPPYLVRVAWDEITLVYAAFAGVLFFVTLLMTVLMSREQLSTILKLGDA